MKTTFKKQLVDKTWINKNIISPGWQRDIYPARVNSFVAKIRAEQFFQSILTVSERENGNLILLDGQHKIEAIKKTDTSFKMDLCIYSGLTKEEEVKIYKMLNDVKQQRIIDDIKIYIGNHDWLDAILDEKNFPINITKSGGINSIRIDKLLNVLKNGLSFNSFQRQNLSRRNLPGFMDDLDAERYEFIKDFCIFYKKCFDEPFKDNWLYDTNIMTLLMKIWIVNKDNYPEEILIKRFSAIKYNGSIRMETKGVDSTTIKALTYKIYGTLNKGLSANQFIEFWNIEDVK